ncbi:MAG TPA: ABC transporter permease [Saprospiraceae bacterium]|nr:ABC transporter permease [Saprospiraceae bacterium]
MIKNYLTTIRRNIQRNFGHSLINVAGLTLGLGCSLVLYLIINHYTTFDKEHPHGDRIYRIVGSSLYQSKTNYGAGLPGAFPEAFETDFQDIENGLSISALPRAHITIHMPEGDANTFEESYGVSAYVSNTYFNFFQRQWLKGNPSDWKDEPNIVVLSESMANKYFADGEPMGNNITLNQNIEMKVVGIISDAPSNTDFPFNMLISYESIRQLKTNEGWNSTYSDDQYYVMLNPGQNPEQINSRFADFITRHTNPERAESSTYWLQPLSEMKFDTRFHTYTFVVIPKEIIWTLAFIAIFLILTACVNFINLSTAVAVKRSREVGIRKVVGGSRSQLMGQFLGETALISLIAVFFALCVTSITLSWLAQYINLSLQLDFFNNPRLIMVMFLLWVTVTLLSGLYPALMMSSYNPIKALKNQIAEGGDKNFNLRKGLVAFQFIISQTFIIGVIVLIAQTKYFYNKDLGFNKEAVVSVSIPTPKDIERKKTLRTELSKIAGAERVALGYTNPSSGSVSVTSFRMEGDEENYLTHIKTGDGNYIDTYGMQLIAGEGLLDGDTITRIVVNEKFAKHLGFPMPEDIIGKMITYDRSTVPVTGVVKDFHTMSLRTEIEPVMLFNRIDSYRTAAVKIHAGKINETISQIEKAWKELYPEFTFQYMFLEQELDNFYEQEKKMLGLFSIFTGISIFIGCLGLYGLVSYITTRKVKEVGIRKVLGASVSQIVLLFTKEFFLLIMIGFVVAAPLSWFLMNKWLSEFAYRIQLSIEIFVAGLLVTIIIAIFTVGYRSVRAAFANPVNALRSE